MSRVTVQQALGIENNSAVSESPKVFKSIMFIIVEEFLISVYGSWILKM